MSGIRVLARAREPVDERVQRRQLVGARHAVVHQRAGEELAARLVVDHLLVQRLADALRHAAVDLSLHLRGVDRAPDVVGREVWPYDDVKDHWDQLVLRATVTAAHEPSEIERAMDVIGEAGKKLGVIK